MFFTLCKKETAPMTTVHFVLRMSTPEGSSYEYTDRFMQEISKLVDDLFLPKSGFGNYFTWFWVFICKQWVC
jgi:hypothetical protein